MKSKSTKAHEISKADKLAVWERQNGKSLFPPYRPITVEMCCCHFVPRSHGGLGYEWNIFGCYQSAWCDEHKAFDNQLSDSEVKKITNLTVDEMHIVVGNHLKQNYFNWTNDNCKYKKYHERSDYNVFRRTNENTKG